jgi:hypothetical protein
MTEHDDRVQDTGGTGAEGGDGGAKDKLPFLPSEDDDTPLGDTDQHSEAPSPPAQSGS